MTKQTSDDLVRAALWEAYGKRCFWQDEPIEFFQLEIDHLIPVSLEKHPAQLKKMLKDAGLPAKFDLQGLQNLVPSCRRCNGQKSAVEFSAQQLMILTMKIGRVLPEVQRILKSKRNIKEFEDVFVAAVRAESNGSWTIGDLVAKFRDNGYIEFNINGHPLERTYAYPAHIRHSLEFLVSHDEVTFSSNIVVITQRAQIDMYNLQITVDDLKNYLLSGAQIQKTTDGSMAVVTRINQATRLYTKYKVKGDQVLVLSCHLTEFAA